jgi:hypothetical protein
MIANEIVFSQKASADLRMRSFFHNLPLPPGTPAEWDKKLKEFDRELHLRFNPESQNFLIFYDHRGKLSVIRSFAQDQSFAMEFWNVKHNSSLSIRHIMRMRKAEKEAEEKRQKDLIRECSEEFGNELHHATRGRVTNDAIVDNDY